MRGIGIVECHVIRLLMDEPAARLGHVAAAVENKVYVWGGLIGRPEVSHDGPDKTDIILQVDILNVKVRVLPW